MEQTKLEIQIKNQLSSRAINPSDNAWDRLDAMLTIAEKPKKRFPWLIVAASFIGFIFIAAIIFKNTIILPSANEPALNKVVVNENVSTNTDLINPNVTTKNTIALVQNHQPPTNKALSKTIKKVSIINQNQNQIAITNEKLNQKNELTHNEIIIQDANNNQLASTILPDNPLPIGNNKISIDSNKLLSQVDNEIKTEYRETVFQKISRKYQTAKTAFVDRNIQK